MVTGETGTGAPPTPPKAAGVDEAGAGRER